MDTDLKQAFENIHARNREIQTQAYYDLLAITDLPVDWAYEIWDGLMADLKHPDNHVRAIASQVLCNLAKSDPEKRILHDFDALLEVTRDVRFVTARHCLQSLWKIGISGDEQRETYLNGLERRFHECSVEKNCTLIRYDILQSFRNVYDIAPDESIRNLALTLLESEPDEKYRKKYAKLWK
jgi:hypothetical protein